MFEIQESPCLGSGIALAVEGDPSLLAKHGPLPSRSYIVLVRPHLLRVGKRGRKGLIGAFDEGFYWHGLEETAAVQAVRRDEVLSRELICPNTWARFDNG